MQAFSGGLPIHTSGALTPAILIAAAVIAGGCAPPPATDPRYPPQPIGCNIQVFQDVPPMQTDNLGPVSARCSSDTATEDCTRTLKDQACKLGGDVLWGVADKPEIKDGRMYLYGRAAHTKSK
jgi:hypothetical protein